MKRRIQAMLCAAFLLLSALLSGCGGADTTTTPSTTTTTTTTQTPPSTQPSQATVIPLSLSAPVKVTGRSAEITTSTAIALDHSASALTFAGTFGGTVSMSGKTLATEGVYFTVYVDGVRQDTRVRYLYGTTTKDLVTDLPYAHHTIEVVRQTEEKRGAFDAKSLSIFGELDAERPKDADLYIEFIGDSITCGLGSLCKRLTASDPLHLSSSAQTCIGSGTEPVIEEDATYGYAYQTARALGADCSLISYSGMGLLKGWADVNMQTYYNYVARQRKGTEEFDFANARKPDFIVVNLGTNDAHFTGEFTTDQFKTAVSNFVAQLRTKWNDPHLKIVFATGLMGTALSNHTQTQLAALNDSNLYQIRTLSQSNGGHNGHPTIEGHETAAIQLLTYLEQQQLVTFPSDES